MKQEDQSTKSFVPGDQESLIIMSAVQNLLIRCASHTNVSDAEHIVAQSAQEVHTGPVDILIGQESHAAASAR